MYIYIYIYIYLSLSLSIYIYIHIHIKQQFGESLLVEREDLRRQPDQHLVHRGRLGRYIYIYRSLSLSIYICIHIFIITLQYDITLHDIISCIIL